jgi:hypothetical protein
MRPQGTAPEQSTKGDIVRTLVLAVALLAFATQTVAATCSEQSQEKKLAGAAKQSFMKKCEADSKASCEASAAERKLSGAAKNSYLTKCVKDAVGGK